MMRVLDLDLDYFLDPPDYDPPNSDERVNDIMCVESIWSENRVRVFLEKNLGLSKDKKSKGCILKGHDEALFFWERLIKSNNLQTPFSVVHIDSHADLGFGNLTPSFICNDLILRDLEYRKPRYCSNCEYDGRYYSIDVGNYLLYAIANRWISHITYCANPNQGASDIPPTILLEKRDIDFSKPQILHIQLKPYDKEEPSDGEFSNEPPIPLQIIPSIGNVKFNGDFDFVSIAQSPNYTPENADYILDIVREYNVEI
jgi:hypothetical protein